MDGIVKYIQVSAFDRSGVPNIELLHPGVMIKTASAHPMIKRAAADLPEREDGIWVLLNAVSAGEYWGCNSNGDFFPEESLKHACDMSLDCPRHLDYGYKTFEKYAFPYRHHANKQPHKSVGERVKLAIWNDEMKRVELIHFLRRDSEFDEFGEVVKIGASDLVRDIESGLSPCVSMGCKVPFDICLSLGSPIKTDRGLVPIEDVKITDKVLTHRGRFRRVRKVMMNEGSRGSVSIKILGRPDKTRATTNHPFFVMSGVTATTNQRRFRRKKFGEDEQTVGIIGYVPPDFKDAGQLTPDDYCLYPVNRGSAAPSVDPWLAGLYLADGSIFGQRHGRKKNKGSWRPMGISWSLGLDKLEIVEQLRHKLIDRGKTLRVYPDGKNGNSVIAVVHDQELASEITRLFGKTKGKHISPEALRWNPNSLLHLICGWLDGDGSQDPKKGSVRGCTVLPRLADGLWEAAVLAGIPAACHKENIEDLAWSASPYAYVLHFPTAVTPRISEHSIKIVSMAKRKKLNSFYIKSNGVEYYAMPIVSVEPGTLEKTYNLSVEEDESYVAGFAAVHNCSICHNKAKNVSLYCDHLKYAMNQTLPDGRQVYAVNTLPKFFDISYVLKGAEKTAKVLMKLASNKEQIRKSGNETAIIITDGMEKAASENRTYILPSAYYAELVNTANGYAKKADDKAAEIKKIIPAEGKKIDDANSLKNVTTSVIHATDPSMPCPVVDRMSKYPMSQIVSTLTALGISLKPQEMGRIVAIKIRGGAKSLDDIGSPKISVDSVKPSLAKLLKEQIEKRSALREPLRRRVLGLLSSSPEEIMDKIAANEEAAQRMATAGLELSTIDKAAPLAALAAALYMMYRKNIKKADLPKHIQKAFGKYPELPAVVVGAGIGGAFGLAGQSMIRGFEHHIEKKAISPLAAKAGLYGGAFAAPYLYSGYVQSKALRGEALGKYEVAAARNPGALAAAGIAGILGRKTIAQKLKSIFSKGIGKSASTHIPISDILTYADDDEIVDRAIAAGICKVASRLVKFIQPVQGGQ